MEEYDLFLFSKTVFIQIFYDILSGENLSQTDFNSKNNNFCILRITRKKSDKNYVLKKSYSFYLGNMI